MHIGILGGGLAGLSLQRFLNHPSEILEREQRPGGLGRSFTKDGFTYDLGGHILFSKNKAIMDFAKECLGENINYCRRNNQILFKGKYVKYPFENGLGVLDREDIYACLIGFLQNAHPKPHNFAEWIYHTFGNGLAERYLIPYNEKIWKCPLNQMSLEWVERVPKPPLEDVVKSALGIETEGYLHQLHFNYPAHGGIETFVRSTGKAGGPITTDFKVTRIAQTSLGWRVSDGERERDFDRLVIAFPIHEAIRCLEHVPADVLAAVRGLRYNSVRVALIGVGNESLMDKSAIYIPDPEVIAHRVCYMGYFSRHNVPAGKSSLIAEITAPPNHELYRASQDSLLEAAIRQLSRVGIIDQNEVVTAELRDSEYGYVVYDQNYSQHMRKIRAYFDSLGISLLGRFAEFEYINMDEVLLRSQRLAQTFNTVSP